MSDYDENEAAIVAALAHTPPGTLVPWSRVRDTLPGGLWPRVSAFDALVERGVVETVKVRGRNYITPADSFSRAAYAAAGSNPLVQRHSASGPRSTSDSARVVGSERNTTPGIEESNPGLCCALTQPPVG